MKLDSVDYSATAYTESLYNIFQNRSHGSENTKAGATFSRTAQSSDSAQLSPFAQLLSTLQQLQQSSPSQYQKVTQTIAANLHTAALSAQSQGTITSANQLNELATDFANAANSGQLPNIRELAEAIGAGGDYQSYSGDAGNELMVISNALLSATA